MKYALYEWHRDNMTGLGICLASLFCSKVGYRPDKSKSAKPSRLVGEFATIEELARVIWADHIDAFDTEEEARMAAELVFKCCAG